MPESMTYLEWVLAWRTMSAMPDSSNEDAAVKLHQAARLLTYYATALESEKVHKSAVVISVHVAFERAGIK